MELSEKQLIESVFAGAPACASCWARASDANLAPSPPRRARREEGGMIRLELT